jgi:hypothetical protein
MWKITILRQKKIIFLPGAPPPPPSPESAPVLELRASGIRITYLISRVYLKWSPFKISNSSDFFHSVWQNAQLVKELKRYTCKLIAFKFSWRYLNISEVSANIRKLAKDHKSYVSATKRLVTCLSCWISMYSILSMINKYGPMGIIKESRPCVCDRDSCGTVALMVLGQFSDICGPVNWPRTIRATVPQLCSCMKHYAILIIDTSVLQYCNVIVREYRRGNKKWTI